MSIVISGSKHSVIWFQKDLIQIGCKSFTIKEWKEKFKNIGIENGYSIDQINEYKGYILICESLYKSYLKIQK